jgi:hypothetical protein
MTDVVIVNGSESIEVGGGNQTIAVIGEVGPKGDKGDQGIQGIQGVKGDTGADAPTTLINEYTFTGNGAQTAFTFNSVNAPSAASILIAIDGVAQASAAYSYLNSGANLVVTLSEAPPNGSAGTVRVLGYAAPVGVASTAAALGPGADRTKLDGIAAGATVNSPDATLLARANHTGTQLVTTISNLGAGTVTSTGATTPRSLSDRSADTLSVKNFGAVGDGTTDDTAAFAAAINAAYLTGKRSVHIPAGTYWFALASAALDPGIGPIDFFGDGMHASVLKWDEGTSTVFEAAGWKALFKNTTTTAKGRISFRNLGFRGTLFDAGGRLSTGAPSLVLSYYDGVVLDHCRFSNIARFGTSFEAINTATVVGCEFDTVMRDMCRFRQSPNVTITGCLFRHCDDDPIALHTVDSLQGDGKIREGLTVTGNVFEDTQRICILGGRTVTVTGNVMRRCHGGITIVGDSTTESLNQVFAVTVANNILQDSITQTSASNIWSAIQVLGYDAKAATESGSIVPTRPDTATGVFVQPYAYRDNRYDVGTDALAPVSAVVITGNQILRTLPAVALYSDWGFGQMLDATGWVDTAQTDARLRVSTGIHATLGTSGLVISNNTVQNCVTGISLIATTPTTDTHGQIIGNVIVDCTTTGISLSRSSVLYAAVRISNNIINCDPYHLSSLRGAGGTWTATTSAIGIKADNVTGASIESNTFSNCSVAVTSGTNGAVDTLNNILICDPAAQGFSTSNKGVGLIPRSSPSYTPQIVDCNPTSATYGALKNICVRTGTAMPTTGTYVVGHFVHNQQPTVFTNRVVLGWARITTGTGHVSGTDWVPCWAATT